MRKILFGIGIALVLVFGVQYCEYRKDEKERVIRHSSIIQKQLKNVGKLVVTEGSYAEVLSYEDSKKLYFDFFSTKKALVVVNAEATISYDLSLIQTEISEEMKTVTITHIPEPELKVYPKIEYYDMEEGYFNKFTAEDLNVIASRVDDSLRKKIEASNLTSNAQNRLISELQKIYILTNSMGWTLEYKGEVLESQESLNDLML
ncbi:DUF4230 domain-containing protein [Aureisphaera galaxeae]|uniref:DUF4230 domain-containing protein n=1 Tax=Aureisphaera galaxeae TaxID=1538023 RepID=UPI002350342A|nr:DUF4230 domain-containing protein [Aureisphaera galaxeae]MDC8003309.1 DUF4230 domain-containing protein [Aureisphaera galaxeae]